MQPDIQSMARNSFISRRENSPPERLVAVDGRSRSVDGATVAAPVFARGRIAAVVYHGGNTEKYLGEVNGLDPPLLMHLAEEDSSSPSLRNLRSRRHWPANRTRQSTAIRVSITHSPGIMGDTTTRRRRSPTGGQANFYIGHCGDRINRAQ
jgi:hypothetical protein